MPDGKIETRYFEILPCFLALTQSEKDQFWREANLENGKTAVSSLIEFSEDKIDELLIQQRIQEASFGLAQTSKRNFITDILVSLILITNFVLFFSIEINDGKTLDNPSFFGWGYEETRALLYTLTALIVLLFSYTTFIQGMIVLWLQSKRALRDEPDSKKKSKLLKCWKVSNYFISNLGGTLLTRGLWCLLLCLGFSIAGVALDFFWA